MPDISTFQGKTIDDQRAGAGILKAMSDSMSNYSQVRFKNDSSAQAYYSSLKGVMGTGQEYLADMGNKAKMSDYATALENSTRTLAQSLDFDGKPAGLGQQILQNLDEAAKQRQSNEDNLGKYISYVETLAGATVALHQISDTYINAQMAKSGWRDKSPYGGANPGWDERHALENNAQAKDFIEFGTLKVDRIDWDGVSTTPAQREALWTNWGKQIKQMAKSGDISDVDAKIAKDALEVYREEPTQVNFFILRIKQQTATETIPSITKSLNSGDLSEDDKKVINDALNAYREDPSLEKFAKLLKAYEIVQPKQNTAARSELHEEV
jgi:hypothetical protein